MAEVRKRTRLYEPHETNLAVKRHRCDNTGKGRYMQFETEELERKPFPFFKKPEQLVSYSVDCNRKIFLNSAKRKIFNSHLDFDRVRFDLNEGFSTHVPKKNEAEHLNILLEGLCSSCLAESADFICWRGLLTKVSCTPYESGRFAEDWQVCAQKLGKTIYLCEYKTAQASAKESKSTERDKKMTFWGHKFEDFVTKKNVADGDDVLNLNEEYAIIVRTRIGEHKLLFGGEVDCFQEDCNKYLELKTTRICSNSQQEYTFRRFKLIKWWIQSFLIGIEDIVCGHRDDGGIVHRLQRFRVQDLPRLSRKDTKTWTPNGCFNFLESFLQFVKSEVTCDLKPYMFTWTVGENQVQLSCPDDAQYYFLPDWYTAPQNTQSVEAH